MSEKQNKSARSTAKIHELEATVQSLSEENIRLKEKLERMNELLLIAQRARFGQSSEKKTYVTGEAPDQLILFNEAELEQDVKAPEPTVSHHTTEIPGKLYVFLCFGKIFSACKLNNFLLVLDTNS